MDDFFKHSGSINWLMSLVVGLLLVTVIGCASLPVGHPSKPLGSQTAAQVERDESECTRIAEEASVGLKRERTADLYVGCMSSRGYRTYMSVYVDGPPSTLLQFEVEQTRGHEVVQAGQDVIACQRVADEVQQWKNRTRGEKIGTGIGMVIGGPIGMATAMSSSPTDRIESAFTACLAERGYSAKRWVPPPR